MNSLHYIAILVILYFHLSDFLFVSKNKIENENGSKTKLGQSESGKTTECMTSTYGVDNSCFFKNKTISKLKRL